MKKERKFTVSDALHDEFVDFIVASEMERILDMLSKQDPSEKKIAKAAKRILEYYTYEGLV